MKAVWDAGQDELQILTITLVIAGANREDFVMLDRIASSKGKLQESCDIEWKSKDNVFAA